VETGPFHIGIAWQGSREADNDYLRSVPLWHFAGLRNLPGIQWLSLQKGDGTQQLSATPHDFLLRDLGSQLDNDGQAFCDTAAVMEHIDLIITCDSALAHVAGALARPVWLLLSTASDWRWLLGRDDTPWYPGMHLFRQSQPGDWGPVFQQVRSALVDQLRTS